MKVLVTGLRGFTGRYLKTELEAHGYSVWGLQANLLDLPALVAEVAQAVPDAVVHLAGIAFVGHGVANDFYRVNLMGTRNLLQAIEQCGKRPDCVLLASSANVYGNVASGELSEESLPNPANDYAVSKLAMEYMARLFADRLPITIVRPFNYTGVGQSNIFLLPKIVDHFKRRAPVIELGNIDVSRDFSDVRVVVDCYRRLLESRAAIGGTFNVCSGRALSLSSVLDLMRGITGHDIEVRVNPSLVRANEVKVLLGSRVRLESVIGPVNDIPIKDTLCWMLGDKSVA